MNILFVGAADAGGNGYYIADAINRFTEHHAVSARLLTSYLDYPVHYDNPPKTKLLELAEWADVIHGRDGIPDYLKLPGKLLFITYTGRSYRRRYPSLIAQCKADGIHICCSTVDLLALNSTDVTWLPNPRPDLMYRAKPDSEFTICHAPTNRKIKNTETIIEATKLAGVKLDLIEGVSFEECLERKARCHAVADQWTFGYGNNAIEGWALGIPSIGGVEDVKYLLALEVNLKRDYTPYLLTPGNVGDIASIMRQLRDDHELYQLAIERGREYFFTYHHTPAVARRAIALYEEAMPKPTARRRKAARPAEKTIEIPNVVQHRPINILQLGKWDFAACGYMLSKALNETSTLCKSRSILRLEQTFKYPHDIFIPEKYTPIEEQQIRELWQAADIIHIHDNPGPLPLNLPARPTLLTVHGSLYRADPPKWNAHYKERGIPITAATLDLTLHGPRWLPDCRPDLSKYVNPSETFLLVQSPSKRKIKGTAGVIEAMQGMEGVTLDLVEGLPFAESLKRTGRATIKLDQFILGYGCSAIEAWSMHIPVVAGATDPAILAAMRRAGAHLPFLECDGSAEGIRTAVARLRDDPTLRKEYADLGWEWWRRFHSPQAVADRAIEFYEELLSTTIRIDLTGEIQNQFAMLLSTPGQRATASPAKSVAKPAARVVQEQERVRMRYLGKAMGKVTFRGPSGEMKEVSARNSVFTVSPGDVAYYERCVDPAMGKKLFARI